MDLLDPQDHKVPQDHQGQLEYLGQLGRKELLGPQGLPEHLEQKVLRVKALKAPLDPLGSLVSKDSLELTDLLELPVSLGLLESKDSLELTDLLGQQGLLDLQG